MYVCMYVCVCIYIYIYTHITYICLKQSPSETSLICLKQSPSSYLNLAMLQGLKNHETCLKSCIPHGSILASGPRKSSECEAL